MRLDRNRIVSATDARTTLPALLDAATEGRTTHILRDRAIVAHVVPADAQLITADVEATLQWSVANAEASYFVEEIEQDGYRNAGDGIGKVLAWAWECSPDTAVRWFRIYVYALFGTLDGLRIGRPAFGQLWSAVRVGLRGFLLDGPIRDFETALRETLSGVFSAAELAGAGRERDAGDPWPDIDRPTGGWAKRRWRDVAAGMYVPDPAWAYVFGERDEWCRVESVAAGEEVLVRRDGGRKTWSVDEAVWVPYRTKDPYSWG